MGRINDRFIVVGESPYQWERDAVQFAFDALEDRSDPYQGRALVELLDPSSGLLHEIDLLIIGYSAIYLVEIKSHPGRMEGDNVDWTWRSPDGRRVYLQSPLSLTNRKCKILRSLLDRQLGTRAPWVQPLVFLSDPDVQIALTDVGRTAVVGRSEFRDAIVHGKFPGNTRLPKDKIRTPTMQALVRAFDGLGLRARKGKDKVGQYSLGQHLYDGPSFQDYEATNDDLPEIKQRARVYRIPERTSTERQAACRRQAQREARLLHEVGDHPNILRVNAYHGSERQGPTLIFDEFTDGVGLDVFLHRHPDLAIDDRLLILSQIRDALAHCHRKEIIHGGLAPESVLIRNNSAGQPETRLINFQLGGSQLISPTVHRTDVLSSPASVYQAPELAREPSAQGPSSDLFSLGALTWFLFTGRPPAADVEARDAILKQHKHLDPWAISSEVPEAIRNAIVEATNLISCARIDDVDMWFECLVADYTEPERALVQYVSPLVAQEGDLLEEGLIVRGVLGHGSSARVLEVERDGQRFALKISLGVAHDDLVRAEGALLKQLRHTAIVPCRDTLVIDDRVCLLLAIAGKQTLQRHLSEEGSLDIDDAIRYGEDLLDALHYLDEENILHRDIKPGNLGIGARSKKARRLTVFDFSLQGVPLANLKVGTDAYRDPYLGERKVWDSAADRWSAAITLHEALTGMRPGWGRLGQPLPDSSLELVLAAERFDPAARESLILFFKRALAADVAERFPTAREMQHAWIGAFDAPRYHPMLGATKARVPAPTPTPSPRLSNLSRITPDTALSELRLSVRATNALERAGISRMAEVLALPNNRLSAIRGIGRKVAREVFDFRERWREHHRNAALPGDVDCFFSGLRGEVLYVVGAGLPEDIAKALDDAGFETLQAVAGAPKHQVERVLLHAGLDTKRLRKELEARTEEAHSGELLSLEGWIDLLLPAPTNKRNRALSILRQLHGLDDPFRGRSDVRRREVATHAGVSRQRVAQVLKKAEDGWLKQANLAGLISLAEQVLDDLGGAAPLDRAAEALARRLDHADAPSDTIRHRAAALWLVLARVAAADERVESPHFHAPRPNGAVWIVRRPEHTSAVRELGRVADSLATRQPLAASSEVERALRGAAEGTPLADLERTRLAELATAASKTAALSSRFEIYPRGLEPRRVIDLSAQLLTTGLSAEEIQARVRARYPESEPLPKDDGLRALLEPLGLRWDPRRNIFSRSRSDTLPSTNFPQSSRAVTAMPGERRARNEKANEARDFEDQLRVLVARGGVRALQLNADWTIKGTRALIDFLRRENPSSTVVHLDHVLLDRMIKLLEDNGTDPSLLTDTDEQGPSGESWEHLIDLAAAAADELLDALLPAKTPLLLVQPGLCARYRLEDFVQGLVDRATRLDGAAVFILVPSIDEAGAPTIRGLDDELPIPGLLPGQRGWVPTSWILNKHRAAG